MQNDKTTLKDLSVFSTDGADDLFGWIDRTTTQAGREALKRHIHHPPDTCEGLRETQDAIKFWAGKNGELWPKVISNGTLVMLTQFFESADTAGSPATGLSLFSGSFFQKIFNKQQYFITRFSLTHLTDFLNGCTQLAEIAEKHNPPPLLKKQLEAIRGELGHRLTGRVLAIAADTKFAELSQLNYLVRREMKNVIPRLVGMYARIDAWRSMALATVEHNWVFPDILPELPICFDTEEMYHPLLTTPVPYTINFGKDRNFLLLTGANMSGKTTFMRAIGVGALLAHLGMGVPARALRISFLQGIITNMHVEDNILKGESYFFAEVQRMKQTALQLLEDKAHLVLMDELFKGTNVHDAYECTQGVISGLLGNTGHLMILSTHLYEVARNFSDSKGMLFSYFVTQLATDGSYHFTYELKPGISNDRIGYLILQKEGIISLLEQAKSKR